MPTENENDLTVLRNCIEKMLDRKISTPKDFDFLSDQILSKLNVLLSPTTLKRLWGYVSSDNTPRESTLSILAQFVGYRNWAAFTSTNLQDRESQSYLILSRKLSAYSLEKGEQVILTWLPDRYCRIEHLGDCRFKVLEARNCKLDVDDTFHCSIFIENEPLYVDNLKHRSFESTSYVAGKKDGIRFEKVK